MGGSGRRSKDGLLNTVSFTAPAVAPLKLLLRSTYKVVVGWLSKTKQNGDSGKEVVLILVERSNPRIQGTVSVP